MSNTGSLKQIESTGKESVGAGRETDQTLILAVDTATDVRSVCVARGPETLSLVQEAQTEAGVSVVLSVIDEALRQAGAKFEEIELFAVATGPGSFTGIRAGLATIKAFAAMSERPVAPVPTLHAVALAAGPASRTIAAIPAGRGEVYMQLLEVGEHSEIRELSEPAHVSPPVLVESAVGWGRSLRWAGGGAWAHRESIAEAANVAGCEWIDSSVDYRLSLLEARDVWSLAPRAESYGEQVARLGLIRTKSGRSVRADEVRAQYVRPSDAELKK